MTIDRIVIPAASRLSALVLVAAAVMSPSLVGGHVDSEYLVDECGSCHVGHGMSGEPMLALAEEEVCYQCHGSAEKRSLMVREGKLLEGAHLGDLEREFQKPYRHPVVEGFGHEKNERLPSYAAGTIGHAECVDCHNPHERVATSIGQKREVPGLSLGGQYLETTLYEYEVCLKCHVARVGAGRAVRDLADEFAAVTVSQHPVTRGARGVRLPSLSTPLAQGQRMRCSDCHGSDDPQAPSGPHGSAYEGLLKDYYSLETVGDESPLSYALCYRCHDRSSILANESFPLHREHVVGDLLSGRPGTSCHTCHSSHGSSTGAHLIDFNPQAVDREDQSLRLEYRDFGQGSGECFLKCHGHNHAPGAY